LVSHRKSENVPFQFPAT